MATQVPFLNKEGTDGWKLADEYRTHGHESFTAEPFNVPLDHLFLHPGSLDTQWNFSEEVYGPRVPAEYQADVLNGRRICVTPYSWVAQVCIACLTSRVPLLMATARATQMIRIGVAGGRPAPRGPQRVPLWRRRCQPRNWLLRKG